MDKKEIIEITRGSSFYPGMLTSIPSPPDRLYCIGDIGLLKKRCVAIVGSRRTTPYGRKTARELASKIASRGVVVVSGMAAGIDTCAHEGALGVEGATIAILGCGPDICYPSINRQLKALIESSGLIISEYPPGTEPKKFYFPQRNRIISGISEAVVVAQAGIKSGAVITAEYGASQGKSVYAVPGNIDSQYNLGSNKLIQDGAEIVLSPGDLLDKLRLAVLPEDEADKTLSDSEKKVYYELAARGELTVDQLSFHTGIVMRDLMRILAVMELKGIVFSDMGKIFVAKY